MDLLAQRIVCMEYGKADVYTGGYSKYLEQSAAKREALWDAYDHQKKEIEAMEGFIRRFRYTASRAALVQSRIKMLDKIERVEPPFHPTAIHFDFPAAPPSYRDVLTLRNLGHRYGDLRVFSGLDLTIQRGEKIGLVGINGAGKSTLLRLLAGREQPTEGSCEYGGKVRMSYFAQYDTATLNSNETLLQAIEAEAPTQEAHRSRDLLGAFLFSGEDVQKPLRALSGGERTRFRLARMLFSPANLLLLDEPTNHLDVTSRATVEKALHSYTGTLIVVSHDRVFMDRVTGKIIEIEDGKLRVYPGKYNDYLAYKERLLAEQAGADEEEGGGAKTQASAPALSRSPQAVLSRSPQAGPARSAPAVAAPPRVDKEHRIQDREARKALSRQKQSLEKKIRTVERGIGKEEARLAEIDRQLASPAVASDYSRLAPLTEERRQSVARHEELLREWAALHEELEAMESRNSAFPE
jgi:ATP-binding cassette subfamily F protein 3